MDKTFKATDIQIGFHPEGYRIDKTASPIAFIQNGNLHLKAHG